MILGRFEGRWAVSRGGLAALSAVLAACAGRPAETPRDPDPEEDQAMCGGVRESPRVEVIRPTDADEPPADPGESAKAPAEILDVTLTLDGAPVTHAFPAKQLVNRSVPFYFEPPESFVFKRVDLCSKPFGDAQYKCEPMKRLGPGLAYEIGCERTSARGALKLYVRFVDKEGAPTGSLGSPKEPLVVQIVDKLAGALPRLPGGPPPTLCRWTQPDRP